MNYEPKTGVDAGKRNLENIKKFREENPEATGVDIAKALGLSLPTVYGHLSKFKVKQCQDG